MILWMTWLVYDLQPKVQTPHMLVSKWQISLSGHKKIGKVKNRMPQVWAEKLSVR